MRLRTDERRRKLITAEEEYARVDQIVGLFLSSLSALPAKIAGADLHGRRRIEAVVREIRIELATEANRLADEAGEPIEA